MLKPREAHAEPLTAVAVNGEVVVIGAVTAAFTPECALETSRRVMQAAEDAIRQRMEAPAE